MVSGMRESISELAPVFRESISDCIRARLEEGGGGGVEKQVVGQVAGQVTEPRPPTIFLILSSLLSCAQRPPPPTPSRAHPPACPPTRPPARMHAARTCTLPLAHLFLDFVFPAAQLA